MTDNSEMDQFNQQINDYMSEVNNLMKDDITQGIYETTKNLETVYNTKVNFFYVCQQVDNIINFQINNKIKSIINPDNNLEDWVFQDFFFWTNIKPICPKLVYLDKKVLAVNLNRWFRNPTALKYINQLLGKISETYNKIPTGTTYGLIGLLAAAGAGAVGATTVAGVVGVTTVVVGAVASRNNQNVYMFFPDFDFDTNDNKIIGGIADEMKRKMLKLTYHKGGAVLFKIENNITISDKISSRLKEYKQIKGLDNIVAYISLSGTIVFYIGDNNNNNVISLSYEEINKYIIDIFGNYFEDSVLSRQRSKFFNEIFSDKLREPTDINNKLETLNKESLDLQQKLYKSLETIAETEPNQGLYTKKLDNSNKPEPSTIDYYNRKFFADIQNGNIDLIKQGIDKNIFEMRTKKLDNIMLSDKDVRGKKKHCQYQQEMGAKISIVGATIDKAAKRLSFFNDEDSYKAEIERIKKATNQLKMYKDELEYQKIQEQGELPASLKAVGEEATAAAGAAASALRGVGASALRGVGAVVQGVGSFLSNAAFEPIDEGKKDQ